MDDNKEDDIRLRDKFAIEILQAYIGREGNHTISAFINNFDHDNTGVKDDTFKHMERHIIAAYKIADIIRKVRLIVFE